MHSELAHSLTKESPTPATSDSIRALIKPPFPSTPQMPRNSHHRTFTYLPKFFSVCAINLRASLSQLHMTFPSRTFIASWTMFDPRLDGDGGELSIRVGQKMAKSDGKKAKCWTKAAEAVSTSPALDNDEQTQWVEQPRAPVPIGSPFSAS